MARPVFARIGAGRLLRVYVGGQNSNLNTVARFAWTENFLAGSPSWTENNTGLSANATCSELLADPDAPGSRVYYLASDNVLYKNDTARTGGNWAVILNKTIVDTVLGAVSSTVELQCFDVAEADATDANGLLAVGVEVGPTGTTRSNLYIFVSDDKGANWTTTAVLHNWVGGYHGWMNVRIAPDDHDRMYAAMQHGADFSATSIWRSSDRGATFAELSIVWGAAVRGYVYVPRTGTPTGQEGWVGGDNGAVAIRYSNDGFASVSSLVPGCRLLCPARDNADVLAGYLLKVVTVSTDRGDSFGGGTTMPTNVKDMVSVSQTLWLLCYQSATAKALMSCSEATLATWVDRTGDLAWNSPQQLSYDPTTA